MGNDNTPLGTDKISQRLFEIISSMPTSEKRDLLDVLEIMHASKSSDRRRHNRKAPLTNMDCLMHEIVLKDCIQNISQTGVFIETAHSFSVGQRLSMAILIPGNKKPIQIKGTIVRVDSDGVAVEFDETILDV